MVWASERTCPLDRLGETPVYPERLLRSAIRLETANRKDFSNHCNHDVAFEDAAISIS